VVERRALDPRGVPPEHHAAGPEQRDRPPAGEDDPVKFRVLVAVLLPVLAAAAELPALSPPRTGRTAPNDAAVVIGIEDYAFGLPPAPYAVRDARVFADFLRDTVGIPRQRVKELTGDFAISDAIVDEVREKAKLVGPGGTLWIYFSGHGAPSPDGDAFLYGAAVNPDGKYVEKHAVRRSALQRLAGTVPAGARAVVVLDACFSGKGRDGAALGNTRFAAPSSLLAAPKVAVWSAAQGSEYAGPLEPARHGLFTYFAVGALSGWADADADGQVDLREAERYVRDGMALALERAGRAQAPELTAPDDADRWVVAALGSSGARAPDLRSLLDVAPAARPDAFVPVMVTSDPPGAALRVDGKEVGRTPWTDFLGAGEHTFEASTAAHDAARTTLRVVPQSAGQAQLVTLRLAARKGFVQVLVRGPDGAAAPARVQLDGGPAATAPATLEASEGRHVVVATDAAGRSAKVQVDVLAGRTARAVLELGAGAPGPAAIEWVSLPGGRYTMGRPDGEKYELPNRSVTVKPFQIAKTEVTVAQYRACVQAGACTPPATGGECTWGLEGRERHPVNCVDWAQARAFSAWAGGRLPTEAEWEFAARSGGADQDYPWGDTPATCERAVMSEGGLFEMASWGCGEKAYWPVCSKPAGNSRQGLCDLAGNVWEWVEDCYGSYADPPKDGGQCEKRVLRGGTLSSDARGVRASKRGANEPGKRTGNGFRVARSVP
jgi:formylglycine-generating enzyme required for sulfatase activity